MPSIKLALVYAISFSLLLQVAAPHVCQPAESKPADTLVRAKSELDHGSYGKVLAILGNSHDTDSLLLRSKALIALGDDGNINDCLERILQTQPQNREALITRAIYRLQWKSRSAEEIATLKHLLALQPEDPEVQSALGRWLYLTGEKDEGMRLLKSAWSRKPTSFLCAENLAETHISQLDDNRALAVLDRSVLLNPGSPEPLMSRAHISELAGRTDRALEDYRKAQVVNPYCPTLYYRRARFLMTAGKLQQSISDCDRALKLVSNDVFRNKVLRIRIKCERDLGRLTEAVRDAQTIVGEQTDDRRLDKAAKSTLLSMASDLRSLGQNEAALKTLERLLKSDPTDTSAIFLKATVESDLHKYESALRTVDKLIEIDAGIPQWHRLRAMVLSKLGRRQEAIDEEKRAKE